MKERNKSVPKFLKHVRLNAMMEAVKNGVTHGEQLAKEADLAARRVTDGLGSQSEKKFVSLTKKIPQIDHLRNPTPIEDRELNTDKWIVLKKPIYGKRLLRLQIKSSPTGVEAFKSSEDFKKDPLYIVINSRRTRKDKEIIKDFELELARVTKILEFQRKP